MLLKIYTLLHVLISLVAIAAGFVVALGMLKSRRLVGATKFFLITTSITSLTGFFFPFQGLTPALITGVISCVVLAVAFYALYGRKLAGGWRATYVVSALFAFYLNVFVLVVQSFVKIPALKQIAPTQNDPPFKIAQLVVLIAFIVLGVLAVKRFRPEPMAPMQ